MSILVYEECDIVLTFLFATLNEMGRHFKKIKICVYVRLDMCRCLGKPE